MPDVRLLSRADPREQLSLLRQRGLNFDPDREAPFTAQRGWRVDSYAGSLPAEPPGLPLEGGSWDIARRLSEDYEFVDPRLLRAYYDPREPLTGRTILLEVRFYGLRIYAGVRTGEVADSFRQQQRRQARVSAWSYRTLEGHFEAGEISYEVWKWIDTGEVEFRIDAFSRPEPISDPLLRLGFRLFGRKTQVTFARRACERMQALTAAAQREGPPEPPPLARGDLAVRPQLGDPRSLPGSP